MSPKHQKHAQKETMFRVAKDERGEFSRDAGHCLGGSSYDLGGQDEAITAT